MENGSEKGGDGNGRDRKMRLCLYKEMKNIFIGLKDRGEEDASFESAQAGNEPNAKSEEANHLGGNVVQLFTE